MMLASTPKDYGRKIAACKGHGGLQVDSKGGAKPGDKSGKKKMSPAKIAGTLKIVHNKGGDKPIDGEGWQS